MVCGFGGKVGKGPDCINGTSCMRLGMTIDQGGGEGRSFLRTWMKWFRFNSRASRSRDMLFCRLMQQAVVTNPVTYHAVTTKIR
jgi:hypothetical protein